MSNEISLIGRNGWEATARFEDNDPTHCVALYVFKDSVPDVPGIVWTEGINPAFRYATNPAPDLNKLMDAGYQAHGEEQDWLDTGKWPN